MLCVVVSDQGVNWCYLSVMYVIVLVSCLRVLKKLKRVFVVSSIVCHYDNALCLRSAIFYVFGKYFLVFYIHG